VTTRWHKVVTDDPGESRILTGTFLYHDAGMFRMFCTVANVVCQKGFTPLGRIFDALDLEGNGCQGPVQAFEKEIHGMSPQFFLVAEVIFDQPVVDPGCESNFPGTCTIESPFRKQV